MVKNFYGTFKHPFHLVRPSKWPFFTAMTLFVIPLGFVMYFQRVWGGALVFLLGFFSLCFCLYYWFGDIIYEATFERQHTLAVQQGLRIGFILFLISETMFFFSFFWAFFHSALSPAIQIGGVWPPQGIIPIDPWGIPLLNTLLLLYSGLTVTLAHQIIKAQKFGEKINPEFADFLEITIFYGAIFTLFQVQEYFAASFSISDSVYGSLFYIMTGFHGLHVIVGTIMLIVSFIRYQRGHFEQGGALGFDFAAWYWHFVDIIWILLYVCLYHWGGA